MVELENPPLRDADRGVVRVVSVGLLIGLIAACVAGATIWLLLADPVTMANAIEDGDISPLVRELAQALVNALANLLEYL